MLQQGFLNERACDNRDQMDLRTLTLVTPRRRGSRFCAEVQYQAGFQHSRE